MAERSIQNASQNASKINANMYSKRNQTFDTKNHKDYLIFNLAELHKPAFFLWKTYIRER